MLIDILFLIIGLALILGGASQLTDGAASVARRLGISELTVGLTVVAFGTSAPELVISLLAALDGNAPMAIGNVVGSNIFNILIILGVTALVRPIAVERSVMSMEIPMVVLSSIVMLMLGNEVLLDGAPVNEISRTDGIMLLVFFLLFMRYTLATAKNTTASPEAETIKEMPAWRSSLAIIGGLAALVFGGDLFVDGATGLARAIGMSDAVIGLTIVAAGTSLPELATSVAAAIKGRPGIAIGNVIGSNIFNILMVLGVSATITPLPFGGISNLDLLTLLGASLMFLLFARVIGTRTITRAEGLFMVLCYVAYTWVLLARI